MTRRVLMVAFQFPPLRGSSGIQRILTFSRYLQEDHGWEVTVLTVHPRAYAATGDDLMKDIAPGTEVVRAFGCDTSRHLSVAGRYPLWLALPDIYGSWWLGAVPAGLRLLRRKRFDAIWSTFPVATAHWIAHTLHRRTGVPWVADFRDSMTEENHPRPRRKWKVHRRLERHTVERSARSVFTTPGTRRMYEERYPHVPPARWAVIANGYDEATFRDASAGAPAPRPDRPVTLVHSGLLYRSERDPRAFFGALGDLKRAGRVSRDTLQVVLRASGDEEYHREHAAREGVEDLVRLEPPLPYRDALAEMLAADALLLFQATNCNHQIPAKVYEYLRSRRPILALTDPAGDTAGVLREADTGAILRLDSRKEIAAGLPGFLENVAAGRVKLAGDAEIRRHSRRSRAAELAALLEQVREGSPG